MRVFLPSRMKEPGDLVWHHDVVAVLAASEIGKPVTDVISKPAAELISPATGFVGAVHVRVGDLVTPGTHILSITTTFAAARELILSAK